MKFLDWAELAVIVFVWVVIAANLALGIHVFLESLHR